MAGLDINALESAETYDENARRSVGTANTFAVFYRTLVEGGVPSELAGDMTRTYFNVNITLAFGLDGSTDDQ